VKKGGLRFSHQIVQAALVHPRRQPVIPLTAEQVKNTDGTEKQDCETKIKKVHPKLPLVIVADGLYPKQPMVESLISHDMRYVLVAKPDDHKMLVEWAPPQ
jgi:hypothetical protein